MEYLELVNWIAYLIILYEVSTNYKNAYRYDGNIEHFQKRSVLSPYGDARGLTAGSLEFDKRAVAIVHELLSFTTEKRLVTDNLTHFRREFVKPQKRMRLLLKHFGIFYASEKGKRFSVFLTEAYEGRERIEKGPSFIWKEKFLSFVGYRGKKNRIETFSDISDMEYVNLVENDSENESMGTQFEDEETGWFRGCFTCKEPRYGNWRAWLCLQGY